MMSCLITVSHFHFLICFIKNFWFDYGLTVKYFADHSQFLSLIEQLKEAAKAKHESNQDELTENTGDEEQPELSPQTNVWPLSLVLYLLSLVFFSTEI